MTLVISDTALKSFLQLFDTNDKIKVIELGDTQHPGSGFITEEILGKVETVHDILKHDYEFNGLVYFEAIILNNVKIVFSNEAYHLTGKKELLKKIISKIKMLNSCAEEPKYDFKILN